MTLTSDADRMQQFQKRWLQNLYQQRDILDQLIEDAGGKPQKRHSSNGFPFDNLANAIDWALINVLEKPMTKGVNASLIWLRKRLDRKKG